ncbi:MAG: sigma-54-dependent Fis family transcriptional regulator, partial [Chitinophagia bacterium]|nr:sigma-54-dependent Fis family transcriptional regulator [Chitinophagia bacterium]
VQQFLSNKEPARSLALIPASQASNGGGHSADFSSERDILYKLFFDMKKDMNDLKQMIFDVANHQGYTPQEPGSVSRMQVYPDAEMQQSTYLPVNTNVPILIEPGVSHEDVDETLSISDKEQELITKALRKHKSRRKDAANELGISERTLYRKIKEYGIKE